MKIFILEDDLDRIQRFKEKLKDHTLVFSDNVEKAKKIIESLGPFDVYYLDHDLDGKIFVNSDEPNTGYQLAKYLAKNNIKAAFVTHTHNSEGAKNICSILPTCNEVPFYYLF